MTEQSPVLTDTYGRDHSYLRISLTERCNLRCTYCMPAEGIPLSPRSHMMSFEEIYTLAKHFTDHGVRKIRLTGGEPLVRKDVSRVFEKLATLPAELSITTNGVLADRFIRDFKKYGIQKINVSLDSLNREKNTSITRRDYFEKVFNNIKLLVAEGFIVKMNCVLIKGLNDNEVIDFIDLTKEMPLTVRFIEFMPFDGNRWNLTQLVSLEDILKQVTDHYGPFGAQRIADAPNDTSRNYRIEGYKGQFAVISSVTNPFCDSCNRIRLTADGKLKNCLFSSSEYDLLSVLRKGHDIVPVIATAVQSKKKIRNGLNSLEAFTDTDNHLHNRSMIAIGG